MKASLSMNLGGHTVVFGGSGEIGRAVVLAAAKSGAKKITFTYGGNKVVADALAEELKRQKVKVFYASVKPSDDVAVRDFLESAVKAQGEEIKHSVYAIGISPNKRSTWSDASGWKVTMLAPAIFLR